MQLEMALGQVFRVGAPLAFGKLDRRWRGVGLAMGLIAFGIVTYYMAILAWGNVYLVQSFFAEIPWDISNANGTEAISIPSDHFFNEVLKLSADPLETEIIASTVFAGAFVMWAVVFLILWKGADFISKAVWVTVLLPVLMLFILLGVGASLEGSSDGVYQYIGRWDVSALSNGEMWSDAFGQIFFSLSLSTGVMTAYASMNPKNQDIVKDAAIVSVLNCVFSFIAGFAVFTIIGYMAQESGLGFGEELTSKLSGVSLAFVAYPSALTLIGDGGIVSNLLCILFFSTFFMLGVDSAFSLTEAVVMSWRESKLFCDYSRLEMTMLVCFVSGMWTIMYTSDIGLYMLDCIDDYIGGMGLLFVGYMEALLAGWVYKRAVIVEKVGSAAMICHEVGYVGGTMLFTLLCMCLPHIDPSMGQGTVIGISVGCGLAVLVIGEGTAYALAGRQSSTPGYDLWIHQTDLLRAVLNETITQDKPQNWSLTKGWGMLIKFVISPLLAFLLVQRIENRWAAGGYLDYPAIYQATGAMAVITLFLLIAGGWVFPQWYTVPTKETLK